MVFANIIVNDIAVDAVVVIAVLVIAVVVNELRKQKGYFFLRNMEGFTILEISRFAFHLTKTILCKDTLM